MKLQDIPKISKHRLIKPKAVFNKFAGLQHTADVKRKREYMKKLSIPVLLASLALFQVACSRTSDTAGKAEKRALHYHKFHDQKSDTVLFCMRKTVAVKREVKTTFSAMKANFMSRSDWRWIQKDSVHTFELLDIAYDTNNVLLVNYFNTKEDSTNFKEKVPLELNYSVKEKAKQKRALEKLKAIKGWTVRMIAGDSIYFESNPVLPAEKLQTKDAYNPMDELRVHLNTVQLKRVLGALIRKPKKEFKLDSLYQEGTREFKGTKGMNIRLSYSSDTANESTQSLTTFDTKESFIRSSVEMSLNKTFPLAIKNERLKRQYRKPIMVSETITIKSDIRKVNPDFIGDHRCNSNLTYY